MDKKWLDTCITAGEFLYGEYDALQREIIETEQELKNLAREAAEAKPA